MRFKAAASVAVAALLTVLVHAEGQQKPTVAIPQPGVPQIMSIEGTYVRAAYNNEGYVILGYQIANESVGEEWVLLEIGTTLRTGKPAYKLTRNALTLDTPDGKTIPLATVTEYRAANLMALQQRQKVMRDSINYFPPGATRACRIGFFSELGSSPVQVFDEVELSPQRACLGQLFFRVPGGIKYGQHWLNVKFQGSLIRVPFRILTKDEQKLLSKNLKSIKQQVDEAFK
jgi:hypothetical protein